MNTDLFIRRPVMTTLIMAGLLIFGVMAYRQLPVSDLPNVDFPTIQVAASLPGASPETMASAVATPLERQFSTIAGIDSMTSTSALGLTQITVVFTLDRNIDARGPGHPGGHRGRGAAPAARHAHAAVVQEGQPGRSAGPVPGAELADAAAVHRGRIRPDRCWRSASRRSAASPRCRSSARRSTPCASSSTRGPWRRSASASTRSRTRSPSPTSTCRPARSTASTSPSTSRRRAS